MKYDDDIVGLVSVYKNGELVCRKKNVITDEGKGWLVDRLVTNGVGGLPQMQTVAEPVTKIRWGLGTTAATVNDTGLATAFSGAQPFQTIQDSITVDSNSFVIQPNGTHETFAYFVDSQLSSSATTVTVAHPQIFPEAQSGNTDTHYFMEIADASGNSIPSETVKVTNTATHTVTAGGQRRSVFTIQRAQQSTTARTFYGPSGQDERNTVRCLKPRCTHFIEETYTSQTSPVIREAVLEAERTQASNLPNDTVCLSRIVFGTGFTRSQDDKIQIVWDILFT